MMMEDDSTDIPDEEIPPGLEKKWRNQSPDIERKCESCGRDVSIESLLCLYCGESTGQMAGLLSRLRRLLTASPLGVILFFGILTAVFFLFVM